MSDPCPGNPSVFSPENDPATIPLDIPGAGDEPTPASQSCAPSNTSCFQPVDPCQPPCPTFPTPCPSLPSVESGKHVRVSDSLSCQNHLDNVANSILHQQAAGVVKWANGADGNRFKLPELFEGEGTPPYLAGLDDDGLVAQYPTEKMFKEPCFYGSLDDISSTFALAGVEVLDGGDPDEIERCLKEVVPSPLEIILPKGGDIPAFATFVLDCDGNPTKEIKYNVPAEAEEEDTLYYAYFRPRQVCCPDLSEITVLDLVYKTAECYEDVFAGGIPDNWVVCDGGSKQLFTEADMADYILSLYSLVDGTNTTVTGTGTVGDPWMVNVADMSGTPDTLALTGFGREHYLKPFEEGVSQGTSLADVIANTSLSIVLDFDATVHFNFYVGQEPGQYDNSNGGSDIHMSISINGTPVTTGYYDGTTQFNCYSAGSGAGSWVQDLPAGSYTITLNNVNSVETLNEDAIADGAWIQAFWVRSEIDLLT